MDIARGPEPDAPTLSRTQPDVAEARTAEPAAVAALPQHEREGFHAMNASVDGHLARVEAGSEVPPTLSGAVRAQADVYASLGLEPPASYPEVRARLGGDVAQAERSHDPRDVERAVATIREALVDRPGPGSDVSNTDLHRIQDTIRGLSRTDATAAVGQLSDAEVTKWGAEVNEGYVRGRGAGTLQDGFSLDEKKALLGTLAERLDATQMVRFTAALSDGPAGSEGFLAGRAVSENAPPAMQRAFVRAGARSEDPEVGVAAGEVLAGLRGAALDRTLERVHADGTMDALVSGAVREEIGNSGSHVTVTYDADTLGRMLRTAAGAGSALGRASLVDSAARELAAVEDAGGFNLTAFRGDSVGQIRGGITSIIERDPVAVVQALENDIAPFGGAFPSYLASMIDSGQSDRVGQMLAQIGTGNGTARSSAEWVTQQTIDDGGSPHYQNAVTLGFALGGVRAAIESLSDDARERGDMVKDIFGTAAGVAGTVNAPAGAVAAVLTGATGLAVDGVVDRAVARNTALAQTLTELAFPRNADGSLYNGAAESDFKSTFSAVVLSSP